MAPVRRQAIIWINDDLVYWCKYTSLGLNELIHTHAQKDSNQNSSFNVKFQTLLLTKIYTHTFNDRRIGTHGGLYLAYRYIANILVSYTALVLLLLQNKSALFALNGWIGALTQHLNFLMRFVLMCSFENRFKRKTVHFKLSECNNNTKMEGVVENITKPLIIQAIW